MMNNRMGLRRFHPTGPAVAAALALCAGTGAQATGVEWGYSGNTGPEHWGENFTLCGIGRNQSPIDITPDSHTLDIAGLVSEQKTIASKPVEFLTIKPNYQTVPLKILNNGHTVEVEYEPGSEMTVLGRTSELKQFHFHSLSEHQINGASFPLEMHLVHADEKGNLTVIGVLFQEGEPNPFLGTLWKHLPEDIGEEVVVADEEINVGDMLPSDSTYYYYNGSLTTPPCSEGVTWLVLKKSLEASKEQIEALQTAIGFANNRPVQPVNARVVLTW
jgi:carbonic anhydrase